MIDFKIIMMMLRNEKNESIRIPRNFRLNRAIELKYSNAFQTFTENVKNLTIKRFKFIHNKC